MKKRGFTLIELMVVVVIIGILAAIAIPNFVRVIDRAKVASVKANMHTVQVTVEAMSIDHMGRYPDAGVAGDQDDIENDLPGNFKNPYDGGNVASGTAIEWTNAHTNEGIVMFTSVDEGGVTYDGTSYTVYGAGKGNFGVGLTLTPGQ